MKNILEKIKINAKKMKKKICNFFNKSSLGIKITLEGALIFLDVKIVSYFAVYSIFWEEMRFSTLSWRFFYIFCVDDIIVNSGGNDTNNNYITVVIILV